MNGALFTGFLIFCSLWTLGSFLKQCSFCGSKVSYDDCQSKVSIINCSSDSQPCFQADIQYTNANDTQRHFSKGCLRPELCANYSKGIIGSCLSLESAGYTGICKGKCCDGNNCNNRNLLLESSATTKPTTSSTTIKPTTNKGVAFAISMIVLFFGFLLTLVNFN